MLGQDTGGPGPCQGKASIVPVALAGVVSGCGKEDRMKPPILPSARLERHVLRASWTTWITIAILALALGAPTPSQQPPEAAQSIADAARRARAQKPNPAASSKVFTNDDLAVASAPASETAISQESSAKQAEASAPPPTGCSSPDDDRLRAELQAAREELDQVHRGLSADRPVISGDNVDMTNFKPGSSGLAFGSPPLLETQPQSPERINEVILEQKVESLKKDSQIACDSPKEAKIQEKLDSAEKQLKQLQRLFDLDRDTYYSKPNYTEDTAGKAKLDDEQQQLQSLQSEIAGLKSDLATQQANQAAK